MPFSYDLVIIGGTFVARDAALFARSLGARVALVEPERSAAEPSMDGRWWNYAIANLAQTADQLNRGEAFGLPITPDGGRDRPSWQINWAEAMAWTTTAIANLEAEQSLVSLAAKGIDVVLGEARFQAREPMLLVGDRPLQARNYLIATGSQSGLPNIEGLNTIRPLTPDRLYRTESLPHLPKRLIVIGAEPPAVELAQTFARLGSDVVLASGGDRLLPYEDSEAAGLIQAHLEADGIQVLTQTPITLIRQLGDCKWAQIGSRAIEADELLVVDRPQPNIATLQLDAVGVSRKPYGIGVNRKLQTDHPRIYACGSVIGGYPFEHIGQYEAKLAVKNALFLPIHSVNYTPIPWAIFTHPALARVGLTEVQAQRRYGKDVVILRSSFKSLVKTHLCAEPAGFCKIVLRQNGEILGAHLVGNGAEDVVSAIALLIQNRIPMHQLTRFPAISLSASAILQHIAERWQHDQRKRNTLCSDWLEKWFSWRRG